MYIFSALDCACEVCAGLLGDLLWLYIYFNVSRTSWLIQDKVSSLGYILIFFNFFLRCCREIWTIYKSLLLWKSIKSCTVLVTLRLLKTIMGWSSNKKESYLTKRLSVQSMMTIYLEINFLRVSLTPKCCRVKQVIPWDQSRCV